MELRDMIREKFRSEAECARKMGWSRQRFHPIASGKRLPNVRELNQIAAVLDFFDAFPPLTTRYRRRHRQNAPYPPPTTSGR